MEKLNILPARKQGIQFFTAKEKLSSSYNPIIESQAIIEPYLIKYKLNNNQENRPFLFLGFFPVYHLVEFLKKKTNSPFLIFDHTPIKKDDFQKAWIAVQGENVCPFSKLNLTQEIKEVDQFLSNLTDDQIDKIILVPTRYFSSNKHLNLIHKLIEEKVFHQAKSLHQQTATESYFYPLWNIHFLSNLKKNCQHFINDIKIKPNLDSFKQIEQPPTCLLISSGPSLDEVLEKKTSIIKKLSQNIPVFCVPAMAHKLQQKEIHPTAIIASDASFYNRLHFEKVHPSIPIIAPLTIHPAIARNSHRIYFYIDLKEYFDLFKQSSLAPVNFLEMDASVVLVAVKLLSRMGFKQIITAGIDFSLHPFKGHACGNTSEEKLFSIADRIRPYSTLVEQLYKPIPIKTDSPLENFLENKMDKASTHANYTDSKLLAYYKQFNKIRDFLNQNQVKIINALSDDVKNLTLSNAHLHFENEMVDKGIFLKVVSSIKDNVDNKLNKKNTHPWLLKRWQSIF